MRAAGHAGPSAVSPEHGGNAERDQELGCQALARVRGRSPQNRWRQGLQLRNQPELPTPGFAVVHAA